MKGKIFFGVVLVAVVVVISIFVLVIGNQPLKVGFIGTLTGKTSTHDISVRNGVLLKMEQVNSSGGISGKKIEMIYEDDKADSNEAVKALETLINEDVLVVLGPPTSGVAADIIDIANKEDILLIAPTAASNYFNSLDDNLIRIVTPTNQMGKIIAEYLDENENYENILAFYDTSNEAYCLDVINVFDEFFSNDLFNRHTGLFITGTPDVNVAFRGQLEMQTLVCSISLQDFPYASVYENPVIF